MEQIKYVVFAKYDYNGAPACFYGENRDRPEYKTLQGLVDYAGNWRGAVLGTTTPVAWGINDGGDIERLRAESIAAGRLIEKRNGKYIPLGIPEQEKETEQKFRIGGVYRQRDGDIVRLRESSLFNERGAGWATPVEHDSFGFGFRLLSDGTDTHNIEGGGRDLLPGELHQVDGHWVPIGNPIEKKAAIRIPQAKHVCYTPAGLAVTGADLRMIARDGDPKPKAAAPVPAVTRSAKPALPALTVLRDSGHQPYYMHGSALLHTKKN